jgi:ribosome biogenesis GTPase A
MTKLKENNEALSRSEFLATAILKIVDSLPGFVPLKSELQEKLDKLRSVLQGLRPPRIMVVGRSRSGKSSLINAICGLKVAEVSDAKPETGMAEWKGIFRTNCPRFFSNWRSSYWSQCWYDWYC